MMHPLPFPTFHAAVFRAFFVGIALFMAIPAMAQIAINPPTRTFGKDGGGGAILTSGTGTWTATTTTPWINVTPTTTGNAGVSCVYVVNANLSADTRQGTISISGNTHTVTQTGYAATLTPASGSATLNGSSATIAVNTSAGIAWTAVSNAAWITVSPASGISTGNVTYTVAPYAGVVSRNGSLTIAGKTFTVTQTGADVNLSPKSVTKAYSSDIIQVQVSALGTTSWTATSPNPWISIVDGGNGYGDSTVTLAINTNPSFAERTGTVSIGTASVSILQSGTPYPVLDLIPREATADPIGAYGNAAVLATSDAPWTAESLDPWIILSGGASGAGNGNIEYVASANPTLAPRTGRIRVNPPVAAPTVDLTWMLLSSVIGGAADHSGWERNLSGSLATRFNGLTPLTMSGQDFNRGTDDSFSICLQVELGDLDTINRLLSVARDAGGSFTTIYVDDTNRLIFRSGTQTLTTTLTVTAGTTYQLIVTTDSSHAVKIYAAARGGSDILLVGSQSFTVAPFPASYVTPARITLGSTQLPTPGTLTNAALNDLRIYGRALNAREASAVYVNAGKSNPYVLSPPPGSPVPVAQYNLNGNGMSYGAAPFSSASNWTTVPDRFGLSNRALQSVTGGSVFTQIAGFFSWSEAQDHAGARGGRLAVLDTAEKVGRIFGLMGWIGLHDAETEGTFKWTDGSNATIFQWLTGQPDNGFNVEDYVEVLGNTTWVDSPEFVKRAYILEKWTGPAFRVLVADLGASATYSYWLKAHTFPLSGHQLIQSNSDGLSLGLASGPSLQLRVNGTLLSSFAAPLVAEQWHHVVLSGASGGVSRVFLDGSEVGNTSALGGQKFDSLTGTSNTREFTIGGWNGAIDQVSYYNGALTSAQVKAIYEFEKPITVFHTVTQGVVTPVVAPMAVNLPAAGGSGTTALTIAQNVSWSVTADRPWISLTSPASGAGSTSVAFDVAANPTVYPRRGELVVAGKSVTVTQAGLNANVTHDDLTFSTDGGSGWIEVSPEGNGQWQAISDTPWLTVAVGAAGAGSGSVFVVADPYNAVSGSRTGSVTVAGQKIYITQRGYELSINPQVAQVGSNAGAGEFGVAAPISAVWEAIATHPWITITGGTTGLGNGTIRYSLAANTTGASRTGRIIVAGKEYSVTQKTSLLLTTEVLGNGSVTDSGSYNTNAVAVLQATPQAGHVFSHWSGDAVGSVNPLNLIMDTSKTVTANFIPALAASSLAAGLGYVPPGQLVAERAAAVQGVIDAPNPYGLFTTAQVTSQVASERAAAVQGVLAAPNTYDLFTKAQVDAERSAGSRDVIAAPGLFDLFTRTQLVTERAAAVQGVLDAPNPYGLFTKTQMHGLGLGAPVLEKNPLTGKMNLRLGLKLSTNLTDWTELGVASGDVGVANGKLDVQITPQGNAAFYRIETK